MFVAYQGRNSIITGSLVDKEEGRRVREDVRTEAEGRVMQGHEPRNVGSFYKMEKSGNPSLL